MRGRGSAVHTNNFHFRSVEKQQMMHTDRAHCVLAACTTYKRLPPQQSMTATAWHATRDIVGL